MRSNARLQRRLPPQRCFPFGLRLLRSCRRRAASTPFRTELTASSRTGDRSARREALRLPACAEGNRPGRPCSPRAAGTARSSCRRRPESAVVATSAGSITRARGRARARSRSSPAAAPPSSRSGRRGRSCSSRPLSASRPIEEPVDASTVASRASCRIALRLASPSVRRLRGASTNSLTR